MAQQDVFDINKKSVGKINLSDAIFGVEVNGPLLHEAVKAYLANQRQGNASTKTRGEVKATKAKPYRQKGTGRARHGSSVSPLFVGGGITFGPKPRDFSLIVNKKKKNAALRSAISSKVAEGKLLVIDKWEEKKKTKEMVEVFKKMGIKSALIVLDQPLEWLTRTVSNIPHIGVAYAHLLTPYYIIDFDYVICTKDVIKKLQERLEK